MLLAFLPFSLELSAFVHLSTQFIENLRPDPTNGRNGILAEKVGITTLGRYSVLVSTCGNAELGHLGVQGGGFQAQ